MVRLGADTSLVTASHVLGGYEERVEGGERINWQVGNLPPFDPIPRIVWRNRDRDIVVLRIRYIDDNFFWNQFLKTPRKSHEAERWLRSALRSGAVDVDTAYLTRWRDELNQVEVLLGDP